MLTVSGVSMVKQVGRAMGALSLLLFGCAGSADGPTGGGGSGGSSDTASGGHLPGAPASQGAYSLTVKSASPTPSGKSCPVTATTTSIPPITGPDALDDHTYLHWVVDGEGPTSVSCRVVGESSFTFAGKIAVGGKALEITGGALGADHHGSATIAVSDSENLSVALRSAPGNCTVVASSSGGLNALQVQPGSMWASFVCPSVEAPPNDYCTVDGVFVLENCLQK